MKRLFRLLVIALFGFLILMSSTYGWRFWGKKAMKSGKEKNLAKTLQAHVYKLSSEIGERSLFMPEKLKQSARYLEEQFTSFGYTVEFQEYNVFDKEVKNIIVSKQGTERPAEIIVVGAHYDSCFNPGADDNGSAVAGLLELARFLSDKTTNRTVRFIAFVNEEPPFFKTENMGSRFYARRAKAQKEDIKAVLILEMIGYYSEKPFSQHYPPLFGLFYPNKGNFICVVGNLQSHWLVKRVVSAFKSHSEFPIESVATFGFVTGVDFSDHWSFWQEGYPAVMITDTGFYRNPHYHTYSDTYEKLDYLSLAAVVKGLGSVLVELAE